MFSTSEASIAEPSRKRVAEDHDTTVIRPAKRRELPWKGTSPPASHDASLCDRCNNIEWSELLRRAPESRYGQVLATLPTSQLELRQSHCRVCKLIALIFPPSLEFETYKLKAFSSRISFAYSLRSERECTVIYVVPRDEGREGLGERPGRIGWHQTGCLGLVDRNGGEDQCGAREIFPGKINWGLVKGWMAMCEKHTKTCKPDHKKRLRGLRVFDCQTRSVVGAPPICNYVALSYVWGPKLPGGEGDSDFPLVVEDSISVTNALGLRYLWVDKYCIDQDDPNKQEQVACMDQIYSQAELTIVSAAGSDDRYGLPGVSSRERKPQRKTSIGAVNLLQIPPHTSHTLRSSAWASRGWTYQEGILSRRRLVFTDHEVSWICNAMHCAESVRMPQEQLNKKDKDTPFTGFLPRIVNSNRGSEDLWHDYRDIKGHIMEFSKRQLSYDSDVLNAMLGIFNSLKGSKGKLIRNLHGMPVKVGSNDFVLPLCWYHAEPARRREGFPSWSWAGWDGGVEMAYGYADIHVPENCEIQVQDRSGDMIPLARVGHSAVLPSSGHHLEVLFITAKTIKVKLIEKTFTGLKDSFSQETQKGTVGFLNGYHAALPITENVTAFVYAYLDLDILPETDIVGLILGKQSSTTGVGILLLQPHGEIYQRIGMVRYRNGLGSEAGGKGLSYVVYMDAEENVLHEIDTTTSWPLWLGEAEVRTLGLI